MISKSVTTTTKTAGGVFLSCGQKNYLVAELCARADHNSDHKKETADISRTKRYLKQPCPDKKVNSDISYKEELFAKKKCHGLLLSSTIGTNNTGTGGSRIILRDELTSFGMTLLKQARVVQEAADLKFVWPGRDGVILVRATDNSKVEKIRNAKDLEKLQHQHPKRPLDGSLLNSTMLSLNGAPAPKQQKQL